MSDFRPKNPDLLVDTDVNCSLFHCCGDEDLIIIKCPHCSRIMVQCYECETLYFDLDDLSKVISTVTDYPDPIACPWCGEQFPEYTYLAEENFEKYLVTKEEVLGTGHPEILADHPVI